MIAARLLAEPGPVSDGEDAALGIDALRTGVWMLSRWLHAQGVDVVALDLDNSPAWVRCDLAALDAGVALVPLPPFFSAAQRQWTFENAGVELILQSADRPLPPGFVDAGPVPGPAMDLQAGRRSADGATRPHTGTAKITYTSGTTGQPRGACLDAASQLQVAEAIRAAVGDAGVQRHLCVLPLATLLENVAGVWAPLLEGVEIIAPPLARVGQPAGGGFDAGAFFAAIGRWQPSSLILVPQLLMALVTGLELGLLEAPALRFVAVGGARVSPALLARARRVGVPVFQGYGLSEACSVVTLNVPGAEREDSVGRPLGHARVRVTDDGEIQVAGPRMLGYLGGPRLSEDWLATGDEGRLDADGFLQVHGRRRNVFISSWGRNLSPEWIESELTTQLAIGQAVALGEAQPFVIALISPRNPAAEDGELDAAVRAANAGLPTHARVARWVRLPRPLGEEDGTTTANGRVRRERVLDLHGAAIRAAFQSGPDPDLIRAPQEFSCPSTTV